MLQLAAFADEISPDLDEQIRVCRANGVSHFELRGVDNVNVLDFDDAMCERIKTALANYLKLSGGNEVTVALKAYNSYRFTVNGEVSRPGLYTSTNYLRVGDALALAGGPTRFAKRSDIRILRSDASGQQVSIPIDFDLVASGKRPDMNVWIQSDDVVWVP